MSSDQIDLDQELVQREVNEAELAAVAFLARYSDRTLEAYRQDLRFFFAWTASVGLEVLAATRPHIELFRHHMEQRGLAPSTIDRRLATREGLLTNPTARQDWLAIPGTREPHRTRLVLDTTRPLDLLVDEALRYIREHEKAAAS